MFRSSFRAGRVSGARLATLLVAGILFSHGLPAPSAAAERFAPPVLTEECAAKAAFLHFTTAHDPVMLPEQGFRVVEVVLREGFYAVAIALVDHTNGGVVLRVAARVVVDGTSGDVVRFYLVPAEPAALDRIFDAAIKPAVTADDLAGVAEAMLAREAELTSAVLAELRERRGDALERAVRFLELLRARDLFLLELAQPVGARLAAAAFGAAQAGEFPLDRETIRLLAALRGE